MNPLIPPLLCPLLHEYARLVDRELPGRVSAFYLEGSIALEAFNTRLSDIDFIAILSSTATADDFEKLLKIHKTIENKHPQWKLEGSYHQLRSLGCSDEAVEPFLIYHDGKLDRRDHFGLASVTWWVLKNHGLAVFGPPPQALPFAVDMDDLIRKQHENMNAYWASWTRRPGRILSLLSDWGIQWTVLGVLRQFYTLHERQITSKTKAGEYALVRLPERWHSLIREAIALRGDNRKSYYRSRFRRALEAYRFLRYTIQSCNEEPS